MVSRLSVLLASFALASIASPVATSAEAKRGSELDYVLHCSGCHYMDGSGHPEQGIPDFREQVGFFLRLPVGRAFLLQVPGLINSGLPDERRASVTNYLLRQYAGASLPADFQPYTAEEARRYLQTRPADIAATRRKLYQELNALGYALR